MGPENAEQPTLDVDTRPLLGDAVLSCSLPRFKRRTDRYRGDEGEHRPDSHSQHGRLAQKRFNVSL